MRWQNRWVLLGLLVGWALSHASVFGDQAEADPKEARKPPTAAEKVRQGLDKKVTLDFTAQSLSDALDRLRQKTGLPISVDQQAVLNAGLNPDDNAQVQVKAADEKASQVLRKVVNAYRLAYIVFEDSILVTTEEVAGYRQMRQQVSVDVEDVPFGRAARDLARTYGVNVVIDPRVAKEAKRPVSLQLENAGLETTLRVMAELVDLKAVRIGNVVFVTNEERAEKLRREEPGDLNGGMPIGPALGGGGIGGLMPNRGIPPVADPPPVGVPPVADPQQ